jgi:hypothetical protein
VTHFWPELRKWLGQVRDTRDQGRVTYRTAFMVWTGLMVFVLKLGSRRQLHFELATPEAVANLNALAGSRQETIAHGDTVNHFLGHVDPRELSRLRMRMLRRLIRMKVLDRGRLMGHFLVVVDGTGQLRFRRRHCDRCLKQTKDGETRYYHNVLEAKLITPDGLALSIATEFIENSDPGDTKQDCELKAFYRLAGQLNKDFPRLRLCLALDSLYARGPVMELCRENRWKYIITFKEGSLPALWTEYRALKDLCPENRLTRSPRNNGPTQRFAWVEGLEHVDHKGRSHHTTAVECRELDADGDERLFAWLTNFRVNRQNVADLAGRGGRLRWKIENEGFNIQKNGGFDLEHAYSYDNRQIKGFYLLMQIAHMIVQLLERGSLLGGDCRRLFGSFKAFTRRLAESLRNHLIPAPALDPAVARTFQIRLDTS